MLRLCVVRVLEKQRASQVVIAKNEVHAHHAVAGHWKQSPCERTRKVTEGNLGFPSVRSLAEVAAERQPDH